MHHSGSQSRQYPRKQSLQQHLSLTPIHAETHYAQNPGWLYTRDGKTLSRNSPKDDESKSLKKLSICGARVVPPVKNRRPIQDLAFIR